MKIARSTVLAVAGLLVFFMGVLPPTPSRADEVDYVSVAIDALQVGGAAVHVFITDDEKRFLKPLVSCLADKGTSVTVQECGTEMITKQLPEETQFFAKCMVQRTDMTSCAKDAALDKLPDDVEQPARCLLDGKSPDVCASNAVLSHLEPQEQEAVRCLARTRNAAACGIDYARSKAEDDFSAAWGKVKGDVAQIGTKAEGPIKNLVDMALGIRDDDWVKVTLAGGAVATKIAGRIVLKIFLGGVGDIVFGPAVDAAVDHRIGTVAGVIRAAKSRDPGAVAEVLIAANMGYGVFVACSVIRGDQLPVIRDFQKAACLSLGAIINEIADVGGSIVNKIADLIKFDSIANKIESIFHDSRLGLMILAGEKTGKCKPVKEAYKDIFAKCYSKQAFLNINDAPAKKSFPNDLYLNCRDHYLNCSFANDDVLEKTCRFLTEQYVVDTEMLTKSIRPEAERAVAANVTSRGCNSPAFDDAERTGLELTCKKHLDAIFPPTGSIDTQDCGQPKTPTPAFGGPAYGLYEPVCKEAVNASEKSQLEICIASLKTPDCTGGKVALAGLCVCPSGFMWDDAAGRCVNSLPIVLASPCKGGMQQDPFTRKCKCPGTQLWDGTKCKLDKSTFSANGGPKFPGTASPCTGGMRLAADGKCECPPATYWSRGQCTPASAPIQGDAKDKFVFNDGGTYTNTGTENIRRCSGHRPNGTWPNCCPRRTYYSNGMCRYVDRGTGNGSTTITAPAVPKNACVGRACCPVGTFYGNGVCRRMFVDPKPPPPGSQPKGASKPLGIRACPASRPIGRPPYCCPVGTQYTMGACRRALGVGTAKGGGGGGGCPASRPVGRPPYCCPSGTTYSNGACRRPAAIVPDKRGPSYGAATPTCKADEKRGTDGKCYSQGPR